MSKIKQVLEGTAKATSPKTTRPSPPPVKASPRSTPRDPFFSDDARRQAVNDRSTSRWIPRRKGWLR